jgi:carbamate kinase
VALGEPLEATNEADAAGDAARSLTRAGESHQLVITHGNGPQVGLLSLIDEEYTEVEPYPLDVLDAETAGQIGYILELQLDNLADHQNAVTVITRIVVDETDPAFRSPSRFIGPVYPEAKARVLAKQHGWTVQVDGSWWRRVVPSPEPRRIVELEAIRRLVDAGFVVLCAGGGGIPVVEQAGGVLRGVEAVIEKDLASSLLACDLHADALVLATDVDAVYDGYGGADPLRISRATPTALRTRDFASGSIGPKVEAACRFAEATGRRAVIGSLDEVAEMLAGVAGTQVQTGGPDLEYSEFTPPARESHDASDDASPRWRRQ